MAVDRFAGQLRWMRSYPKNRAVQTDGDRPAPRVLPPADLTEILRWRNTPAASGAVALFAPQDTPETFALKAASGELLWRSHALSGFTLLGIHNSLAIFAGPSVQAIHITTNKTAWQYRPSKNQPITGPAALIGAYVHVPTGGGLVSLRADSGSPAPQAPQPPNLAALTRSDMLRPTLERADIAFTFDLPEPDTLKVGNLTLKLPTGPVPPAVADAFAAFAPGWRLANCGDQNQPGLLKEYLGRSPVFVTQPLDANTPCTIARILRLPKDRRVALKLRAAHAPKSDWRLVVKVNGKQEIDRIIDHAATADNWFRSYVELAPYAGQQIMIELIHYPTAWANESAYWGPLVFENR
jgi:hypothetical protein